MQMAQYQCQGCKHTQRLLINGPKECQRCGGTYEKLHHPLMASNPSPSGQVIAYGSTKGERFFSESVIERMVDELMEEIGVRLAAECELDRIDALWYNEEKGDSDDEEADNGDRV